MTTEGFDWDRDRDLDERARIGYDAVVEAAVRFGTGEIGDDELVALCVAQDIVEQCPILRVPVNEAALRRRGPLEGLGKARRLGLISGAIYNRTLDAMADRGHQS
jgi:hypothetical protein